MNRLSQRTLWAAALAVILGLVLYEGIWNWTICYVYVPPDQSVMLRYKGAVLPWNREPMAGEGQLATVDSHYQPMQIGVLKEMLGPGRHFINPIYYQITRVPDLVILPGQIGIVTARVGKPLGSGFLVDDEDQYQGIWRRVLTPGRYRMNPYATAVEIKEAHAAVSSAPRSTARTFVSDSQKPDRWATPPPGARSAVQGHQGAATTIPPGYVGVVTNLADNPQTHARQGIQDEVLQPGIYYMNPREKRIDIVGVGYQETSLLVEYQHDARGNILYTAAPPSKEAEDLILDERGDPQYVAGKGIEFPSDDGFPIHMDYTAIWGVWPDQAPDVIRNFGSVAQVEKTVIIPLIESICRMHGSKLGAVELLVGNTREQFQNGTSQELRLRLEGGTSVIEVIDRKEPRREGEPPKVIVRKEKRTDPGKGLNLLSGLVRHIHVPAQIRGPLQRSKIANEMTKTVEQEQKTARVKGQLEEARQQVVLETKRVEAETTKRVAEKQADGEKQAETIGAETVQYVAELDARTAELDAQIATMLGQARAEKVQLKNEADAEQYRLFVDALGSPEAYNRYIFAKNLPANLRLGVFYAGPGTFWTDLKGFQEQLLGKLVSDGQPRRTPSPPTATARRPDGAPK